MATNIHDIAYTLQHALKENEDFIALQEQYEKVFANEETKVLFEEFRNMQMELQQKMMQGEQLSEEDNEKAQAIVTRVQQDVNISALMQAEQRVNMLVMDLNKIIMQPLETLYGVQK
ncbi:YlbF family regulator [Priestia taiwanensis]|uniref:UPF0342 protein GCM10007140_23590 n=1 Tax=Priestia taiwanensis TaxID=1347902 RepID=A0A917AT93_9BACI|nr:YlbF family regulator [Priestia taiwanensis]MBM7364258.1 cell fate (sporulation/competence/biofilm development) regulator YlbF (YheA/YmcA/DUF963 family) [Priestia taiwanensis]GGE72965.1 UPF0342 protein [Priestia taiwanensis]